MLDIFLHRLERQVGNVVTLEELNTNHELVFSTVISLIKAQFLMGNVQADSEAYRTSFGTISVQRSIVDSYRNLHEYNKICKDLR